MLDYTNYKKTVEFEIDITDVKICFKITTKTDADLREYLESFTNYSASKTLFSTIPAWMADAPSYNAECTVKLKTLRWCTSAMLCKFEFMMGRFFCKVLGRDRYIQAHQLMEVK